MLVLKKFLLGLLAVLFVLFAFGASPVQGAQAQKVNTYIFHSNLGANTPFGVYCVGSGTAKWVQINQDSIQKCGSTNLSGIQVLGGTQMKCKPYGASGGATLTYQAGFYGNFPWNSWECWVNNV